MGRFAHHAIVVTGASGAVVIAHEKASATFPWVSPLSPAQTNGYASFFVPPDGSKEGWEESGEGDARRNSFIGWLTKKNMAIEWVEVVFGWETTPMVTRNCEDPDE